MPAERMVPRTTSGHSPRRDSAGGSPEGPSLRKAGLSASPSRWVVYPQAPRAPRLVLEPVRREPHWEAGGTPLCAPFPLVLPGIGAGPGWERWTRKSPHAGGLKNVQSCLFFYVFRGAAGTLGYFRAPMIFGCEVQGAEWRSCRNTFPAAREGQGWGLAAWFWNPVTKPLLSTVASQKLDVARLWARAPQGWPGRPWHLREERGASSPLPGRLRSRWGWTGHWGWMLP